MSYPDPVYLRLYHRYNNSIRAYENAIEKRKILRSNIKSRRSSQNAIRRPVGSLADFRIPDDPFEKTATKPVLKKPRIYLGPILGWAKIIFTKSHDPPPESINILDIEKLYDKISLDLFWNVKNHYEKCKREFFNYVRSHNIKEHRQKVKNALKHEENLQYLGVNSSDGSLESAQIEMETVCKNVLGIYNSSPNPKSTKVISLLLENLADAQFVGLESETTRSMHSEYQKLLASGRLKKEY